MSRRARRRRLLYILPVLATAAGSETFTPSVSTGPIAEIDVFGDNSQLTANALTLVPATIQITGGPPAIGVTGAGQPIADGDGAPSGVNATDFGEAAYGRAPVGQTYPITNSGSSPLGLGSVSLTGDDPNDFAVTSPPAASVAPGGSTT